MAAKPQKMLWEVVELQEVKVGGVAKPPPWVAEPLQLQMVSSAQPPREVQLLAR